MTLTPVAVAEVAPVELPLDGSGSHAVPPVEPEVVAAPPAPVVLLAPPAPAESPHETASAIDVSTAREPTK